MCASRWMKRQDHVSRWRPGEARLPDWPERRKMLVARESSAARTTKCGTKPAVPSSCTSMLRHRSAGAGGSCYPSGFRTNRSTFATARLPPDPWHSGHVTQPTTNTPDVSRKQGQVSTARMGLSRLNEISASTSGRRWRRASLQRLSALRFSNDAVGGVIRKNPGGAAYRWAEIPWVARDYFLGRARRDNMMQPSAKPHRPTLTPSTR